MCVFITEGTSCIILTYQHFWVWMTGHKFTPLGPRKGSIFRKIYKYSQSIGFIWIFNFTYVNRWTDSNNFLIPLFSFGITVFLILHLNFKHKHKQVKSSNETDRRISSDHFYPELCSSETPKTFSYYTISEPRRTPPFPENPVLIFTENIKMKASKLVTEHLLKKIMADFLPVSL